MKRAGMGWLSILFLFIGIGTAFGAIAAYLSNGEQVGDGTIVLWVIAVITYIVYRVLYRAKQNGVANVVLKAVQLTQNILEAMLNGLVLVMANLLQDE